MTNEAKHTAGEYTWFEELYAPEIYVIGPQIDVDGDEGAGRDLIAILPLPEECNWGVRHPENTLGMDETKANAGLIAEAFNVHRETGLTPRQLAEQRAGLLAALKAVMTDHEADKYEPFLTVETVEMVEAAIAKAEGGAA